MKSNKGITLIALIIMVIVLLILASIATTSGVDTIRYTIYNKAKNEMEFMQAQVNTWYSEYNNIISDEEKATYISNIGVATSDTSCNQTALTKTVQATKITAEKFRFLSEDYIKKNLGINSSIEFLVNIPERTVILFNGLKYQEKTYYTIKDFDIMNV